MLTVPSLSAAIAPPSAGHRRDSRLSPSWRTPLLAKLAASDKEMAALRREASAPVILAEAPRPSKLHLVCAVPRVTRYPLHASYRVVYVGSAGSGAEVDACGVLRWEGGGGKGEERDVLRWDHARAGCGATRSCSRIAQARGGDEASLRHEGGGCHTRGGTGGLEGG
jgi:hypothetical protein